MKKNKSYRPNKTISKKIFFLSRKTKAYNKVYYSYLKQIKKKKMKGNIEKSIQSKVSRNNNSHISETKEYPEIRCNSIQKDRKNMTEEDEDQIQIIHKSN